MILVSAFELLVYGLQLCNTVEPRYSAPRYSANLDLVRKIFGPFNKKTFKIDLDFMRIFSAFSIDYIEIRLY